MKNRSVFSIFVIGSLFFVLGFVTWLNSILIPFLKLSCELTDFQSSFVTFAFYISYFVTAIPSSYLLKKVGFNRGMSLGLIIMAIGALLFVPAAMSRSYMIFLVGLFTTGIGLSILQTAVNPYATVIGPIESAARRISIMGICNKVAGMIGIFLLSSLLFSDASNMTEQIAAVTNLADKELALQALSHRVITPYLIMAAILIGLVMVIKAAKLPEIDEEMEDNNSTDADKSIRKYSYLWFGIVAIFFYVGAEVIAIDYLVRFGDFMGLHSVSKTLPIYALIALVVGYLVGIIAVPRFVSQRRALIMQLLLSMILVCVALFGKGIIAVCGVIGLSFTHAIMWPAIWPLSIHDLGKHTKLGAALLIMAISGGAVIPLIYGKISDIFNPQSGIAILFIGYLYLMFFACIGYKLQKK
ncbi:MAG: sugar MFS transporter [Bacteroidales bacterium]|jgi:glucose/galactose transporter|nr:sugar MFS transporter [Bacteroidales bacterium]